MKNSVLPALVIAVVSLAAAPSASGQSSILAEMYGKGVHAYNSCNYTDARQYLSMAIDNGIKDPRAFYFRGMVGYVTGGTFAAESDWQQGADLEAQRSTADPTVGRSLARFQGRGRLKLEEIRQRARLQSLALRAARSQQGRVAVPLGNIAPPPPTVIPSSPRAVTPLPAPPAADDPFANDMAEGDPSVTADDALEAAMDDPFADSAAPADSATPAGDDDPFAAGGDESDPFGGDEGGAEDDPFGTDSGAEDPADGGDAEDPFGEDPFGS